MDASNRKLELDEQTLEFLLNFILKSIQEDRKLALQNHDNLVGMIGGIDGGGLTSLEIQMFLQQLSSALNGFLGNMGKSTDNAIKIAKLLSDHIVKISHDEGLSDADREELAAIAGAEEAFNREKHEIDSTIIDMEGFSGGN